MKKNLNVAFSQILETVADWLPLIDTTCRPSVHHKLILYKHMHKLNQAVLVYYTTERNMHNV